MVRSYEDIECQSACLVSPCAQRRLGGTTSICKASVSMGGTPQSASGGTPCAQRVAAHPVPNATALRGGRVRVAPAPPPAKVLAAALQQNTTLQSLSPNYELGRVRHGQRDGLGRCSCITPPRDKSGAATSDSGAQGVSSEAPGPAPQRSCTPHGVLHRCCAQ